MKTGMWNGVVTAFITMSNVRVCKRVCEYMHELYAYIAARTKLTGNGPEIVPPKRKVTSSSWEKSTVSTVFPSEWLGLPSSVLFAFFQTWFYSHVQIPVETGLPRMYPAIHIKTIIITQ